jgi:hypothetical protein
VLPVFPQFAFARDQVGTGTWATNLILEFSTLFRE